MKKTEKRELWQIAASGGCGAVIGQLTAIWLNPFYWWLGLMAGLIVGAIAGWILFDIKGFFQGLVKAYKYTIGIRTGRFWALTIYQIIPTFVITIEIFVPLYLALSLLPIGIKSLSFVERIPSAAGTYLGVTFMALLMQCVESRFCEKFSKQDAFTVLEDLKLNLIKLKECLSKENFLDTFPSEDQKTLSTWIIFIGGNIWLIKQIPHLPKFIFVTVPIFLYKTTIRFIYYVVLFTQSHGRIVCAIGAIIGVTVGHLIIHLPLHSIVLSGTVGTLSAGTIHLACQWSFKFIKPLVDRYLFADDNLANNHT